MTDGLADWFTEHQRKGGSVLFTTLAMRANRDPTNYRCLFDVDFALENWRYVDGKNSFRRDEIADLETRLRERIDDDSDYLNAVVERHYEQCERLITTAERIGNETYDGAGVSELKRLYDEYVAEASRLFPSLIAIPTVERILLSRLSDAFDRVDGDLDEIVGASEDNFVVDEVRHLLELGAEIQASRSLSAVFANDLPTVRSELEESQPEFLASVEDHADRFGFLDMYYYRGDTLGVENVLSRLRDVLQRDCRRKLEITDDDGLRSLESIDLDSETRRTVELTRELKYLRAHRMDELNRAGAEVRGLLEEIGRRMGFGYQEVVFCTHAEIDAFLTTEVIPDRQTIQRRTESFGAMLVDGEIDVVTDPDSAKDTDQLPTVEEPVKLEGRPASSGTYTGSAKVVLSKDDVPKVEDGDVLVATTTNPTFVPAILRAGAVVTDEGGILSHAGIVARELGIPCVTTTSEATDTFDDGDVVTVDATSETGFVTLEPQS